MDIMQILSKIKANLFLIHDELFDKMTKDDGPGDSFVYLLVSLIIGSIISVPFILMVVPGSVPLGVTTIAVGLIVKLVLDVIIHYAIYCLQFMSIKIFGGKEHLLKSLQVFIYGSTPSLIFGGVPYLNYLMILVSVANVVLGSARIHKMPVWKAAIAIVFVPVVVIVLAFVLLSVFAAYLIADILKTVPVQ